ncbi:MAG: biotin-dependent carboxyltransferase family protein [Acidaminococcales bacterium]|jgi:biotin-dependent carboxylase-like uncharacterized protein|nr:biotin-dependent carboxyltransferase family protein [Acidaminococcales bacterium]
MLKVLNPGLFSTVQDLGRTGFLAFGVPQAGALDDYACRAANLLAGNDENAPLLELTMFGGEYEFCADTLVALAGADMSAELDGAAFGNWLSRRVKKGQKLALSFAVSGCRAYLAVAGGFKIAKTMDSTSTHTRSGIGGMEGRALKKGDLLPIKESAGGQGRILPAGLKPTLGPVLLRVLPGPQEDAFEDGAFAVLESAQYLIEADSDRMGYRLRGPRLQHKAGADIISDALISGGVQVPGSGQPIIMLNDCQTTGGYTKLCFVISPDLPLLAQCRPGDWIKFRAVTEEESLWALAEYEGRLAKLREFAKEKAPACLWRLAVNKEQYDVKIEEVFK